MKNIVLIGAPGCGKGTQGDILKHDFGLLKIALGDILREYRIDKTNEFSSQIDALMDSGKLLPNDLVNAVAKDFIVKNAKNVQGLLFDGYPRSVNQAEFVDKILKDELDTEISIVVMLDLSLDYLIDRLQNRYTCKKCGAIYNKKTNPTKIEGVCDKCQSSDFSIRADDGELSIIKTRFEEFNEKTMPVISYYEAQKKLVKVNAALGVDEVYKAIVSAIKNA